MKTNLRQKYNGLLEKLIRLFTLSGIMFTVTACYGVAPFDTEEKDFVDVEGQVLDENNQPLSSIQVVIQSGHDEHQHRDTVYTNNRGNYRARYIGNCLFLSDDITIIANDTSNVYASDTVHAVSDDIEYVGMNEGADWTINNYYSLENDFQLKKK